MKNLRIYALVLLAGTATWSCSEEDESTTAPPEEVINEQIIADEFYVEGEVTTMVDLAESEISANTGSAPNGRTLNTRPVSRCESFSASFTEGELVLDFGDGCTGVNGKERSGSITVSYNPRNPFGDKSLTFNNFEVDGNRLNGTVRDYDVTINFQEEEGTFAFSREYQDVVLELSDSTTFELDANRTFTATFEGQSLEDFNFIFEVEGRSTGVNREGMAFSSEITSPITINYACLAEGYEYPSSGVMAITGNEGTFSVDFGNGTCDDVATASVGDFTTEINLDD